MRDALLIAAPPTAIFLAIWLYARAENGKESRTNRCQIALWCGWLFLLVAILTPPVFSQYGSAAQDFRSAVCATCALGAAMTAWRTAPSLQIAPLVLFILSSVWIVLYARS